MMPKDDCSRVGCSGIAHSDVNFLAEFIQVVMGWKVFSLQGEKCFVSSLRNF